MKNKCDCIIPFYNEGSKPIYVVDALSKVKSIQNIIVVDDGSDNDSTTIKLNTKFPQIISIRLEKNNGKTDAIRIGLKHVREKYVILFDGDLSNIKPFEIDEAIQKIINNAKIDMIILPLVTDLMKNDWFRVYVILSGQRILQTNDLKDICKDDISGFQIEAAINQYMILKQKNVFWMPSSIRNLSKYKKWGFFQGIKNVFSLFKEIFKYTGWKNFFWQTKFFCKNKAP